ncbi:MAG: hypothetical protein U0736_17800 [Gemmataceae bacterium]
MGASSRHLRRGGCGSIGGYAVNEQTHTDTAWPTTRVRHGGAGRCCGGCHVGDQMPRLAAATNGMCRSGGSSWTTRG